MPASGQAEGEDSADEAFLYAVNLRCANGPSDSTTELLSPEAELTASASLPERSKLLSYYAATQRQDPRGRVVVFPDQHGTAWQLIRTVGHWWEQARLQTQVGAFPETFREALLRRRRPYAAIGWPLTVFRGAEGTAVRPGLLLPARWEMLGDELVLYVEGGRPSLNPHWTREMLRRSAWTEDALVDRLFPEGESDDLGAVSARMTHVLATLGANALRPGDLASDLDLRAEGLSNAAALFLPEDASFTRGAAEDLEAIAEWTDASTRGTALEALFSIEGPANELGAPPELAAESSLTDRQTQAVEASLSGPLTVIQGPPGTGKSHVILSMVLSAFVSGHNVLFASKNHQALDEVERRIREIVPDAPLLTRGRDAEGERDTSFMQALQEIVQGDSRGPIDLSIQRERSALLAMAAERSAARRRERQRTRLHLELCDLMERKDEHAARRSGNDTLRPSLLARLLWELAPWRRRRVENLSHALGESATIAELQARTKAIRRRLSAIEDASVDAGGDVSDTLFGLTARWAQVATLPEESDRRRLAERIKEIQFKPGKSSKGLNAQDGRDVIAYRPLWAISTLSAPARIPLVAGLFDYVIFDEASQCDIASALPLLARAKRAVVVGDPMQLRFIPGVGNATEHALMDAVGLPKVGRARIAQSVNSLFEFCERRPAARRYFLRDQFRSAPGIVQYLNDEFYSRQGLEGRRLNGDFKAPRGYKPGISWDDVAGHVSREDGGNVNVAEAQRVGEILRALSDDEGFDGSVGVLSPFNAQVALISRIADQRLKPAEKERLQLRIGTIDRFQGGEADVILFSLVVASGASHTARNFLQKERRRLNVAVSRARALCLVVGDLAYAKRCGIRHVERLAERATMRTTGPRAAYDSAWERRLATAMEQRGMAFHPQYPVGTRYLDFAIDPGGMKIDVEVDGRRWHTDADGNRKTSDRMRDRELRGLGWTVLRFWVHELAEDMDRCVDRIERELRRR